MKKIHPLIFIFKTVVTEDTSEHLSTVYHPIFEQALINLNQKSIITPIINVKIEVKALRLYG